MSLFLCPHCLQHIKENSVRCPHCKRHIASQNFSDESAETIYGVAMISFPEPPSTQPSVKPDAKNPNEAQQQKNTIKTEPSRLSIQPKATKNKDLWSKIHQWWT